MRRPTAFGFAFVLQTSSCTGASDATEDTHPAPPTPWPVGYNQP